MVTAEAQPVVIADGLTPKFGSNLFCSIHGGRIPLAAAFP